MTVATDARSRLPAGHYSVRSICDAYVKATEARRSPRANEVVVGRLAVVCRLSEQHGLVRAQDLTDDSAPMRLRQAFEDAGYSPHTLKGSISSLRSVIAFAAQKGVLLPLAERTWRVPEPQQKKDRFLTKEEIGVLLAAVEGHPLELPVALGVYQGLRRQEVCDLLASDVDLDRKELTVRRSKNRRWRVLKLHPALLKHLTEPFPTNGQALCLNGRGQTWSGGSLQKAFTRCTKGLAWPDVSFHTLRHTCASMMAQSGKHTLYEIGKFLGHETVQTTVRYAHLLPNQVQPEW